MPPRLSVLTPSLNQARYLEQSIRSVIDQGHSDVEHLVVDGGSRDDSVEVIRRYEHRLAYWVSEPDRGQSHAVNKALDRSTGDWIGWLNSDDYYLPGAFDAVVSTLGKAESDVAFVFGRGLRVGPDGREIGPFWPRTPVFNRDALLYGVDYILQPSVFVRRSAWKAVGPLDETLRYCMDYDLWLRLSEKFKVATVPHAVAASREHRESKTFTGGIERWQEIARMIARHTGGAITPGVMLYLLQTVQDLTRSGSTAPLFGPSFQAGIEALWAKTLVPLTAFSANGDWMPTEGAARPPDADPVAWIAAKIAEPHMAPVVARHDPDRRAEDLLKKIDELTAALRHWESQAAILLEQADASVRFRYMSGRLGHAARRRLDSVVRWILRSGSRTG
jgi:GT2 family glycosyltransferase